MTSHANKPLICAKCALIAAGAGAVTFFMLNGIHAAHAAEPDAPPVIKLSGLVEAGIVLNPDDPTDHINAGQMFTDKANRPQVNQITLTAERAVDSKSAGYDVGFKLQGLFGSDARYTHFLGELDRTIQDRHQLDVVEATVTAHLPLLTEGGIDVKLGQFPSPMSAEVIDPRGNGLYSHSYIFNFGVPFKNTGLLTTTHVNSNLDVFLGLDTGVNTSLGRGGDNNGAWSLQGGFGLTLLDGTVTVAALTHIGPENPRGTSGVRVNHDRRYLNDVVVTWKISDVLTSVTDINYVRDDGVAATGGGVAQYLTYAVSPTWSLVARGEIWRDSQGFYVAKFPGNLDYVNAQFGLPNGSVSGGRTTYGALTLGANFKPVLGDGAYTLMVRPELRYDASLNGTTPFDSGLRGHQLTAAVDVVLAF